MARLSGPQGDAERLARKIGTALARQRPPALTPELDLYLADRPEEILVTLEGFARHAASDRQDAVPLTLGYLFLVQGQLERIRYRRESGFEDAAGLIERFQRRAVDLLAAGRLDGDAVAALASAMHHAGVAASVELTAAIGGHMDRLSAPVDLPTDPAGVFSAVIAAANGDPFALVSALAEAGHALPAEMRASMATGLGLSDDPVGRDAALLLSLDGEPAIRHAAVAALQTQAASLSPVSLRRLIAARNWRPAEERMAIDGIVRSARARGIDCAPWDAGAGETVLASAVDGAGAQGFLVLSPAGRRRRLSSVLLKGGVRDAWSTPPLSRRELDGTMAAVLGEASMMPVSRTLLDRAVRHHLQVGLEAGLLPPAGLLQVAEALGGADWQPERLAWRDVLAEMHAALPAEMHDEAAVREVLEDSAEWAGRVAIAESWFEDDPEVARLLGGGRGLRRGTAPAEAVERVRQDILERRREKWAELFVWAALWLREGADGGLFPQHQFVVLAHALLAGQDLAAISLMDEIAERTVAAVA